MSNCRWFTITSNDGAGDDYHVRAKNQREAWALLGTVHHWFDPADFRPFIVRGRQGKPVQVIGR